MAVACKVFNLVENEPRGPPEDDQSLLGIHVLFIKFNANYL